MNIKNKLIHLLGGYTKCEYEAHNNLKVRTPVIYHEKPIRTLKVNYRLNSYESDEEIEWIKRELAHKISEKLYEDNLIYFEHDKQHEMRSIVKVIDPSEMV